MTDVSVVIATHDRLPLLRDAVASVEQQRTSLDAEIVVADDGSSDGTPDWLGTKPAIRSVRLPHSGRPGVARNAGLARASAELVLFLDDDDLLEPDAIETLAAALRLAPHVAFAFGDVRYVGADDVPEPPFLRDRWRPDRDTLLNLLCGVPLFIDATLVRRRDLLELGGFDESLESAEDLDLWLRLALRGEGVFVDRPVACKRRSDGGVSSRRALAGLCNALRSLRRLRETTELPAGHLRALRRTCCDIEIGASRLQAEAARIAAARAHARNAIRERPGSRNAWLNWLRLSVSRSRRREQTESL